MTDRELAKALQRPGALPALLTASGILAYLVVSHVLSDIVTTLEATGFLTQQQVLERIASGAVFTLTGSAAIAVGVFLAFWQVAPIAPSLRLAHVVTRALLASLVGAIVLFVVYFALSLATGAFSGLLFDGPEIVGTLAIEALATSFRSFLGVLPVVVLGAVFLWGWLQRHPPKQVPKGALDEV